MNNDNSISILLPELNYILITYLNSVNDYKNLTLVNKYYYEFSINHPTYKEYYDFGKYYYQNKTLNEYDRRTRIFLLACHGYLNVAKYIYHPGINISVDGELAFRTACINGHKDIAKWLYKIPKKYNVPNILIHSNIEASFRQSCEFGHIKVAKWLYDISVIAKDKIDIHAENDYAFKYASINGHVEVVQWLYNISQLDNNGVIDIHIEHNSAFKQACINGREKIAEWLYNISKTKGTKINIHDDDEYVFRLACEHGHRNVAEWLYNLYELEKDIQPLYDDDLYDDNDLYNADLYDDDFYGFIRKINIHAKDDYAFRHACAYGHFDIAKWLYNLSSIDNILININTDNEYAFRYACVNNHKHIVEWLYNLSIKNNMNGKII